MRVILTLPTMLIYRARAIGVENVPATGPVILAPNHFSQMDHFFAGVYLRRKVRFMAKSQLFGPPVDHLHLHARRRLPGPPRPPRRGGVQDRRHAILDRGGMLLIYAEGGRSRTGELGEPKPGIGRIALESGVPVVPVAIHGSAGVRRWRRLRFPKVTVQFGEPLTFPVEADPSRERQLEVADQVFDRVREMYATSRRRAAAA